MGAAEEYLAPTPPTIGAARRGPGDEADRLPARGPDRGRAALPPPGRPRRPSSSTRATWAARRRCSTWRRSWSRRRRSQPGYIEPIQKRGHEALDQGRLRQYLEKPDRHPLLQVILAFFEHGLGSATLLDQLEGEERRDRRRLLLDLLVVHGDRRARARAEAAARLDARDRARLRAPQLGLPAAPAAAARRTSPSSPRSTRSPLREPGKTPFLVKEALLYLGYTRHARAAQALVSLLAGLGGARRARTRRRRPAREARSRSIGSRERLARQGGREAWRALVDHALSRRPELGRDARPPRRAGRPGPLERARRGRRGS